MFFGNSKKNGGQGKTEYSLLLALLALVVVAVFSLLGVDLKSIFNPPAQEMASYPPEIRVSSPEETMMIDAREGSMTTTESAAFYDDFNGPLSSRWSFLKTNLWQGEWITSEGKAFGEPFSAMTVNGYNGKNYTITVSGVDLIPLKNSYNGFGIIFRADKDGNGNGYMFEFEKKDASDPGLVFFSKWINGNQIFPPIASATAPAGINWNSLKEVQIKVVEQSFTAFVNGREVLTAKDPFFADGTTGLSANNGAMIAVDTFRIEPVK